MTHASLFTGIGGFDLGFWLAGIETVAQCEIDDHACTVLEHHWPEVTRYRDITKLDGRTLRGVDVITGGFPCQDHSVAGKREGLSGARSGLFFHLARVVEEARPRLLVWENVPGLLSSDTGNAMRTVCGKLASIGYFGAWRVLDSQFYGVPQRRRRVFGAFAPRSAGGWACGAAILLEPEGGAWNPTESREEGAGVAGGAARCLAAGGNDRWAEDKETYVPDAKGVRRLTPLECERLQGFPDGWTDVESMSDTQRYRQCGNAVSVPVAYWIGLRTKMALEASE